MPDLLDSVARPLLPTLFFLFIPFVLLKFEGKKTLGKTLEYLDVRGKDLNLRTVLSSAWLFLAVYAVLLLEAVALYHLDLLDLESVEAALRGQHPAVLVAAVVVTPFAEELFFRGYLQKKIGAVFSAFAFGFLHFIYGSTAEVVFAVSVGLVFGWYVRKNKNLLPCILAHSAFNAVFLFPLLRERLASLAYLLL